MSILDEIKVNRTPTHMVRSPSLTLSKEARKSIGAVENYSPRVKRKHEALAPENDLWKRSTYRTGDGDYTAQVPRAGSLVAFSLPSRGNKT